MYTTRKIFWDRDTNQVFATVEFLDTPGHTIDVPFDIPNILKGPDIQVEYKGVSPQMQIDATGNIFVSNAASMRFKWTPLDPIAVRWAEQSDFDKWCTENPIESFDWNAAVFAAVSTHHAIRLKLQPIHAEITLKTKN